MTGALADRYHQVLENIASAAQTVGRNPNEVQLVVVTKGHSPKEIETVYHLGARHIGENRLDEALAKQQVLHNSLPGLHWHMIGHLQSRKAKLLDGYFSMLHSLDRVKLADRLEQALQASGMLLPVLLQFNVSGEETKSGWDATSETLWPALLPDLERVLACSHLQVRGLMTMAPYSTNPEDSRPHFVRLRQLREFLAKHFPAQSWDQLSMGMSGDYQVAVQEGATLVRVGTAVMGSLY